MRIVIDYDGCITDNLWILKFINKIYNTNFRPQQVKDYNLNKSLGINIDWGKEYSKGLTLDEIFTNTPWRKDVDFYLNKILKENEVYFVTARNPLKEKATKMMFIQNLGYIPENMIFLGHSDKVETINKIEADIIIEDSPDNIQDILQGCKSKVIVMKSPYNTNMINIPKNRLEYVDDWSEVVYCIDYLKAGGRYYGIGF